MSWDKPRREEKGRCAMSRRQYVGLVVVAMVAGVVGGCVGTWTTGGGPAYSGYADGMKVRARAFEVVDEDGRTRAVLGASDDGSVGLSLYEREGTEENQARAALLVTPKGSASVAVLGRAGRPSALLSTEGEFSGLWVLEEDDRAVAILGLLDHGNPGLVLKDGNERERVLVQLPPEGYAALAVRDETGKAVWAAP